MRSAKEKLKNRMVLGRWMAGILACFLVLGTSSLAWGQSADPAGKVSKDSGSSKKKKAQSGKNTAKTKGQPANAKSETFETAMQKLRNAYGRDQNASALVHCKQAIELMPKDLAEDIRFGVMMMCFMLYDKNGQYEEALELGKAMKTMEIPEKQKSGLCFMEATAMTKLHRWEDARQKYRECPGINDQEKAVVESNVAELSMIQGDCKTAVDAYRSSLRHDSKNPHAAFGLAVALSRMEDWKGARRAFLDGVRMDPAFSFLKDAFFEPAAENDYQSGYRMYELGRDREARFFLERYVNSEDRGNYRSLAQKLLLKMDGEPPLLTGTYPVLMDNVRTMAMDEQGRFVAFAGIERDSGEKYSTGIWVVDVREEKAKRVHSIEGQIVTDMAFAGDSTSLRILTPPKRYEVDVAHPEQGYYLYDNPKTSFSMAFSQSARDIIGVGVDGGLTMSPWENPYMLIPLLEIPPETRRLRISYDHQTMVLTTALKTLFVDISHQSIENILPAEFDVEAVAAHPDKKIFALGIHRGVLLVNEKGGIVRMLGTNEPVQALSFNSSGKKLAVLSGQSLEIWDIPDSLFE